MKTDKTPAYNFVIGLDFNEEDAEKIQKAAVEGNIQAKLDIILHNQFILNYKLKKLLNTK